MKRMSVRSRWTPTSRIIEAGPEAVSSRGIKNSQVILYSSPLYNSETVFITRFFYVGWTLGLYIQRLNDISLETWLTYLPFKACVTWWL